MNSNAQLDHHPDAESLNAFVEQALGDRERGQILSHLAECSRCREVVYLAQEAAAAMEPAVAGPEVRIKSGRGPWFRNWWFAWVPAGALAAVVAVAYVAHVRRVELASEMAKVAPPTTQNEVGVSKAPLQTVGLQAAPPPLAATPARSALKVLKPERTSVASKQLTISGAPPTALGASEMSNASRNEAAVPLGESGAENPALGAAAEFKPEPAMAARQQEQEHAGTGYQVQSEKAKVLLQGSIKGSTSESAKSEPIGGMLTAAAPLAQLAASPPNSGSFDASGHRKAGSAFAVYKAIQSELPSGLPAVSTAMAQGRTVAVDRAGTVYLSERSGSHWESVAKQWTGRAVTIRVEPVVGTQESAQPSPAAVFEIVNDQGQAWVSTGGRIWKAK